MSYVKAGIIYRGNLRTCEVHGAELMLSTRKRIITEMGMIKESYKDIPDKLKKHIEHYERCLKKPLEHRSGIVKNRVKLGIAELDTPEQIQKWLGYIEEMNVPGHSEHNYGYPYNSILDIDKKAFYSMRNNWYANYDNYLPDDWKYRELSINEMQDLINKFPAEPQKTGD